MMAPILTPLLFALALSLVSHAYPLDSVHASNTVSNAAPISIEARAAERIMPAASNDESESNADPHNGEIIYHLFNDLGLDKLNDLNDLDNWKKETQPEVKPEPETKADPATTHPPNESQSAEENSHVDAPDSTEHTVDDGRVRNPADDPFGFMSDFLDAISSKLNTAFDASDERTLV